jgi:nicotinamidase-related amidase
MQRLLNLTGRHYRTIPTDRPGYVGEALSLEAGQTAFVSLHCWNIGCPGGPPEDPNYWVGMGFPQTTAEAYRIMKEHVRPCLDAARAAGIAVFHVQAELIARRYPEWFEVEAGLPAAAPPTSAPDPLPAIPGYVERIIARSHGENYATRSPYAQMDFPDVVKPLPSEPIVHQTRQFDRLLRKRGIVNLIYAGFATDMCILDAPGGMGPMFGLGYRVLLIRDATLGVEQPDSFDERIATRRGLFFVETHWGDTITTKDFISNCTRLAM